MSFVHQVLIADGVTAEGRVVFPKAILEIIKNAQVLTMAVNAGGTGYVVGEEFDLNTGTAVALNGATFAARGRVTAESAGVVTGVEFISGGAYTANPTATGGATTNATAAGNDDLTVDVTMQTALWTQDESDYTDLLTAFEWIATSVKATNAPTIGMQSILSGSNDAVRMIVASGYDSGSVFLSQPGTPPTNNFYLNVPNQNPELYVSITERRVNVLVTDGTFKQYGGMGLFIPFTDVAGNYPFPGFIHGQSVSVQAFNTAFSSTNRGICNPIDNGVSSLGPYQYRNNLSTEWFAISADNNFGNDVSRAQLWPSQGDETRYSLTHAPIPSGSTAPSTSTDPFTSTTPGGAFQDDHTQRWFITDDSTTQSQGPAPLGAGGQMHFTVQPHIISNQTNDVQLIGIIDGWENVHGRGLNAFDEIATAAGKRFIVFNDTNTSNLYRWVAMEIV